MSPTKLIVILRNAMDLLATRSFALLRMTCIFCAQRLNNVEIFKK